jgi:basic amino acid/polyamine antiporter, APA family
MTAENTGEFKKSLNLLDSTSMVVGSMVGSGIFIVSADMARNLGSPGWLLVAWAITGIMTVFASLSFGELAGMMPQAGGMYVYLREAYSPLFGFLYGWTVFMVIQCGTIAAIAVAFARFLGVLVPWVAETNTLLSFAGVDLSATKLIAILLILLLTWINARGIEEGKWIQNIFTILKVAILILFVITGFLFIESPVELHWGAASFWHAETSVAGTITSLAGTSILAALGVSMVGSLFSADAWYGITYTSGEVINPKKTIPISLFLGTFIVSALYFLVNVVYVRALPVQGGPAGADVLARGIQYASEDRVATAVIYNFMGSGAAIVMAIVVMISTFGCNNGIIIAGARVYYAMAQDGVFFKPTGRLNKFGVPAIGLYTQAIWSIVLCLSGSYSQLLDYIISAVLIFNVLVIGAIFILRRKKPDTPRPYKAFGYPIIPLSYIVMSVAVFVIILIHKPQYTWPGFIIVVLGVPVYYIWKKINRSANEIKKDNSAIK